MMRLPVIVLFCLSLQAVALELVREGIAKAEIVVAADALPQVVFAAEELQRHVRKMSGATLPIVHGQTGTAVPVFVGSSAEANQAGVSADQLTAESYQVLVTDDYLALIGHDACLPRYPRGFTHIGQRRALQAEWETYAGERWSFPWSDFYDPRNHSPELDFSIYDQTGTLFAVYDLLEELGVRWYLPDDELGTIVPTLSTIDLSVADRTRAPVFSKRHIRFSFPRGDLPGFIWFKRLKLGMSEITWHGHGTSQVTRYLEDEHPEYFSIIGGELQSQSGRKQVGHPRLAPPLREAMVAFCRTLLTRYPELRYVSAAPADGYIDMDDRDKAAGWWHEERGRRGWMSNYVWQFVREVAMEVGETHPEATVLGLAYSTYRLPPTQVEQLPANAGVVFCQSRAKEMVDPAQRQAIAEQRLAWDRLLPSSAFFTWEYYLFYDADSPLRGVPVVFNRLQQEDTQALAGLSRGEYVEAWAGDGWGLKHLMIYLQAKLYWKPDLDLEALIDAYTHDFYGPAAAEMRRFYALAEAIWMRPLPHDDIGEGTFLKATDAQELVALLETAQAKAGDSLAGQRIAMIRDECQPMLDAFEAARQRAMAEQAIAGDDPAMAAGHLRRAAELANNSRDRADAWHRLGNHYAGPLADPEEALSAYREVMAIQLSGAGSAIRYHARIGAAEALRQLDRHDEALALLADFPAAERHLYWQRRRYLAYAQIALDAGQTERARRAYHLLLADDRLSSEQREILEDQLTAITEGAPPP